MSPQGTRLPAVSFFCGSQAGGMEPAQSNGWTGSTRNDKHPLWNVWNWIFYQGVNFFTFTVHETQAWEPLAQHCLKTYSFWKCTLCFVFFIFTEIEIYDSLIQICNRFFFYLSVYSVSLIEWRSICRFQSKCWYICSWNCLKFPVNQIILIRYPWRW